MIVHKILHIAACKNLLKLQQGQIIHYLDKEGILSVGAICSNHLQCYPLVADKDLQKQPRGSFDYKIDNNSGICIVKWNDDSIVQLTSNVVAIDPIQNVLRWNKSTHSGEEVKCPNIVMQYNKSMAGMDLADVSLALYRIMVKTRRWYVKVLQHLVDIAKVNGWILYCRHYAQNSLPPKHKLSLLKFSTELSED